MNSSSAVVCREVFDENSQPSAEEISEYAQQIGIDPESESHLLPLAKDGLMQALPPPWKAYFDEKLQTHYYYNEDTKQTQWEHPLDRVYREMVRRARDASTQDDTYASLQELLTSEEYTKNVERIETKVESEDEVLSTDSDNSDNKEPNNFGTGPKRLQPVSGRPPLAPLIRPSDRNLSDIRMSPLRRSVDGSFSIKPTASRGMPEPSGPLERPKLFKQQSEIIDLKMHVLNSPDEDNFSPLVSLKPEKGLTLSGKGSMFLKTKKTDLPSPDTEKSLNLDSQTKSDPPKSILREKSDPLQRRSDIAIGKTRFAASLEDDRKSVRFNLDNTPFESTVSPGSNSSSEQNEGHSIIASPPFVPSPQIVPSSPIVPSPPKVPLSLNFTSPKFSSILGLSSVPSPPKLLSHPLTLAPLVTRPPLPPRPQASIESNASPRENSQRSSSERESNESDSKDNRGASPRRRVIRPPAADYIKPDLFQKNFQKISDLVRPGDLEPSPGQNLKVDDLGQKEARPRSPLIPLKSKISINLMESIDSETSIDSPDKEFANLDLNDLDDSKDMPKDEESEETNDNIDGKEGKIHEYVTNSHNSTQNEENVDDKMPQNKSLKLVDSVIVPQIKVSTMELKNKSVNSGNLDSKLKLGIKNEVLESKTNSCSDSLDLGTLSKEISNPSRAPVSPQPKISPSHSVSSYNDLRSPRTGLYSSEKGWSSPFKPISLANKAVVAPQIKSSDSNSNLAKMTSPRLDGVILSQSKNAIKGSDNVVVVYQFETNNSVEEKYRSFNQDSNRELIERTKGDERRRLDLALQKELEETRIEWLAKERRMKAELLEELKEAEDRFFIDKKRRLDDQTEKHRRELAQALEEAERNHKDALKSTALEYEEKLRTETESADLRLQESLSKLREDHYQVLSKEKIKLQSESERAMSEIREHLRVELAKERARIVEENRVTVESLREEHSARITELRHDYRAEVERLRAQHACHLQEVRARQATERVQCRRPPSPPHALADKYRCLKEKYARLKHDVKMSIERRNKRRELSMTTGSETEKSNSHKATQSLERCKELNETSASATEPEAARARNNNPTVKYNDNETSLSESNAQKSVTDNNNDEYRNRRTGRGGRPAVAFREPLRHGRDRDKHAGTTTDCQDSSDATTADEKPKESLNGHGRRRCFTRLKSASTSRLNYSPKRGDGWSSPLESLRQQLRKLDDLEDQFPDVACQPAYSLRYPFAEIEGSVSAADMEGGEGTPELEFVRHRALVEREGMRRARAVLRRRRVALRQAADRLRPPSGLQEEREATELEVALHRARALLGEKEIRLRHIERSLRQLSSASHEPPPPPISQLQEVTGSSSSGGEGEAETGAVASGAVLRSLRALHADVRDIWLALDARQPTTASPETSSCNAATTSQPRVTVSAAEEGTVQERARGLRAWLQHHT